MTNENPVEPPEKADIPDFLPYHKQLADLLESHEEGLWRWFASDKLTEQAFDEQRLYLLKNAVRLDAETYPDLYAQAQDVAKRLEITAPVTLYQGQGDNRNAALIFTPGEVNILFQGDLITFLSAAEMTTVLAHEMAHFLHQTREDGRYFNTDRLLEWICGEPNAHQAHGVSAWLSRLYQEVFADRVGLSVSGDRDAAITSLVKVGTGLSKVSVDAYLAQAREALSLNKGDGADGLSHPETYIRAIALDDWATDKTIADDHLADLLQGTAKLERLDLLKQAELTKLTGAFITAFIAADWGDSELLQAHAKMFLPEYERQPQTEEAAKETRENLRKIGEMHETVQDYFAYVLTDFATADPELDDTPLLAALTFSADCGIEAAFDRVATKDLKIKAKKLADLRAAQQEAAI